jgi:hypothetical protein
MTSLVWNFDQGNRSIRAGMRLLMWGLLVVVEDIVAMCAPSNPFLLARVRSAVFPTGEHGKWLALPTLRRRSMR